MKKYDHDTAAPEARREVMRLEEQNSELRILLQRLLTAWEEIPECDPVPDEINLNDLWDEIRAALGKT